MKQKISRYGAYGIVQNKDCILLTLKISGPYKGKWDLPGGGIEFGESPEMAFKRELLEEAALQAVNIQLHDIVTANGTNESFDFHHVGMIYKVNDHITTNQLPQDEIRWVSLSEIHKIELTPLAQQVLVTSLAS